VADVTMLIVGGALKRKEKLSARLGDILSHLYLCSTVLKRYEDEGCQVADLPLLHWAMQTSLFKMQTAFDELLLNFPNKIVACKLRWLVFPAGKPFKGPSDKLGHEIAQLLIEPSVARDRLTQDMYIPRNEDEPLARLEASIKMAGSIEAIELKIRQALKAKQIKGHTREELIADAAKNKIISDAEVENLKRAKALQRSIIMVDDFEPNFAKR
jgi:acyl-CoA dehydrogenase